MRRRKLTKRQQALVTEYLTLATKLAHPWQHARPGHADDFESAANFALVRAARYFDAARGVKFSTYATDKIRSALADLYRKLARPREETNCAMHSWTRAEPPVGYACEVRDEAEGLLQTLPAAYREVCRPLYLEGKTQAATAQALGVSLSKVSYMHVQAIKSLRSTSLL